MQRRVLITGAGRGLGRALAEEFIRAGHVVFGCGRSAEAMADLRRAFGEPHDFAVADVASDAAVAGWAGALLPKHGPPDLLVNNAGLIHAQAPLWEIPAAEFSRVMEVNVNGPANVIRHFVPAMIQARRGVIVNFSSGRGRVAGAKLTLYSASKWAIEGLTQALAQELPPEMAAVPLSPGIINTEMLKISFGERAENYHTADQWAKIAVPYLLSLGRKDNGQSLTIPG